MANKRNLRIERKYTNRSKTVDLYFRDIDRCPRIGPEEEVELAQRIQGGDLEALDLLVKANLRFVISIAKQYSTDPTLLMDLISHGNIGLMEAAKKYDPTLGFKFISFAVWFIRKEILYYYGNLHHTVRMANKVDLDLRRIKRAEVKLEAKLERPPTCEELALELTATGEAISSSKVEDLLKREVSTVALDKGGREEDEFSLISTIEVEDEALLAIENSTSSPRITRIINRLLTALTPIEQEVVHQVLGTRGTAPIRYTTISENYGKSAEWARSVYLRSLRKMQKKYKEITKKDGKISGLF